MLLPSLVQVSESISGSVVPLAMFMYKQTCHDHEEWYLSWKLFVSSSLFPWRNHLHYHHTDLHYHHTDIMTIETLARMTMVCGEKISMRRRMICGKVRNSPGCHQQRTKLPLQNIIHSVVQGGLWGVSGLRLRKSMAEGSRGESYWAEEPDLEGWKTTSISSR